MTTIDWKRMRMIAEWNSRFSVTWWDVEHGLSVLIKTPNGKSIWIDAGHNGDTDFCPAEHVKEKYEESQIDCLVVSHPDLDHISSIDRFIKALGLPKELVYNNSLTNDDYTGDSNVKNILESMINNYIYPIEQTVLLPEYNGGVDFLILYNDKNDVSDVNDSSVFVMCKYMGQVFIFPGDISDNGWKIIWKNNSYKISNFIKDSTVILTAPHHGRKSGYSFDMIKSLSPDLIIISDKYGKEPTYKQFETMGNGLQIGNEKIYFYSTKTLGRIRCSFYNECYQWTTNGL